MHISYGRINKPIRCLLVPFAVARTLTRNVGIFPSFVPKCL